MNNQNFTIPAECHSDDHKVEIDFDAIAWFTSASDEEIKALIDCGYRNSDPTDNIACFFAEYGKDETRKLFDYLETAKDQGFGCSIDEEKASHWIKENRPNLSDYP